MDRQREQETVFDLIGVGIGPFNLSLAAMLKAAPEIDALFLEQKSCFSWHPGLLLEGTTLQVPFLADLVTMADPTSPYSFINYLKEQRRLYHFYFLERFHIPRREYDHYCRWVSEQLHTCRFGQKVVDIEWINAGEESHYRVEAVNIQTKIHTIYRARNLVLGVGSVPQVNPRFAHLPTIDVFHSAHFLDRWERCRQAHSITVVGSGQSAAEVFYTLLQQQEEHGYRLDWFTRSPGFFPMEYSKLGLEHFSPDYIRHFHSLTQQQRDTTLAKQDLLYKGISASTISDIYELLYERTVGGRPLPARLLSHTAIETIERIDDGEGRYRLQCQHRDHPELFFHETDVVILATGYAHRIPDCITNLRPLIQWDDNERYIINADYRLNLNIKTDNHIYIQNGDLHTHGVGAPDLGLGAHRNAVIINSLAGREVYPVFERNVFQQFGRSKQTSPDKISVRG
ncbi:lysine N(6)-hydroxylase/L-ornithine N(5)-oxygenase family protein [Desmospora activa]|uniref:lysine N(6)-hydroxylase/L-ornithine N(5)-oxygenase family protein n=1 Tax=Desmospora activa TaxID=500615 RepID=UPI003CCC0CF7